VARGSPKQQGPEGVPKKAARTGAGKSVQATGPIYTVAEALDYARRECPDRDIREKKKNYAEALSRALATCFANALRPKFPGISPEVDGSRQERRTRSSKGFKKLDVNYSTVDLGLALGVSVKTINAKDVRTGRYTKNYSRVDNELRAEATDYHRRQPYAVLIGVLFLPVDACDDAARGSKGEAGVSSFGAAVRAFRWRVELDTRLPLAEHDHFERFFVALYDPGDGTCRFHDVRQAPPKSRRPRPEETMSFEQVIEEMWIAYRHRNDPPFEWAP
jgi:hypothetical protein